MTRSPTALIRIWAPMHISRNADNRAMTKRVAGPIDPATRSEER